MLIVDLLQGAEFSGGSSKVGDLLAGARCDGVLRCR